MTFPLRISSRWRASAGAGSADAPTILTPIVWQAYGGRRGECAPPDASVRPRQAENMLGQIRHDQVRRDRRDLHQPRLAELALDVEILGEAEAAMRLQAHLGGRPG